MCIDVSAARRHDDATSEATRDVAARRIVHICTRFAQGGSEQRLCDMVAALPEHEHWVIVGRDSDLEYARARLPGRHIVVEPALVRELSPRNDLSAFTRLRMRICDIDAELVVTHQSKAGTLGRLAAHTCGSTPVVHSLSMADFGAGYGAVESAAFRTIERLLARWTAAYAVVGTDLASAFRGIGVPDDRLTVVRSTLKLPPGGSDRIETRRKIARRHGIPDDRPWILYVGSLDDRKGVLDLPLLLQQAIQLAVGPSPFLVVAGGGPHAERLESLLEQTGLSGDCRLLGHVRDPRDLFVAADVVVLLSRAEGLPQVLVQAAAAGTPFVASEVEGVDELLELGAAGTVVERGDLIGAARAVLPYLRWPVERRGSTIDLASWHPAQVRAGYRTVFDSVLETSARTRSVDATASPGKVVAVIGSDGSGKSTLSHALVDAIRPHQEVVHIYFGSGDGPSSILRWPLKRIKRAVFGTDTSSTSSPRGQVIRDRTPRTLGAFRAVWALALAREKRQKLRRARRAVRRGAVVVCDRYPQAQFPGSTDGPLLDGWAQSPIGLQRALARWERTPYETAHREQPHLVIRLNVDQDTALRRRPGYDPQTLLVRRGVVRDLRFDNSESGVVEIDACRPFDAVLSDARVAASVCAEWSRVG